MRFKVGVKKDKVVVGATDSRFAGNENLGLSAVGDRSDGPALDTIADHLGIADEVVARVTGEDAAAFRVGAERLIPPVEQDVVRAHVEVKGSSLTSLTYN